MREIKFRAWEKPDKSVNFEGKMHYDIKVYLPIWLDNPDYEIMQYTGLKDKNGKEIYEGDILGWKKSPKYSLDYNNLPVIFRDGQFCFYSKYNVWGYIVKRVSLTNFLEAKKPCMVIGNIYENPELIIS